MSVRFQRGASYITSVFVALSSVAAQTYEVSGLVLKADLASKQLIVSQQAIPNYMDAMVMPYQVQDVKEIESLQPGMKVQFTLHVDKSLSSISNIRVQPFDSGERDPISARSLSVLESALGQSESPIFAGETVPDFSLIDQTNRPVALSQFRGKVLGITFVYTRCPLPDYCFRLSNNFGQIQKRFQDEMGRNLVLLSISFDPEHDRPEVLAKYASIWKANVNGWHFLTGSLSDVKRVCGMFGMNFWPDEGILTHSLHTAVVDRRGKLVANIEGNQFTAQQLGDLIQITLRAQ